MVRGLTLATLKPSNVIKDDASFAGQYVIAHLSFHICDHVTHSNRDL